MLKVIVRIKGGLGNQLFCYAVARRLALVNDAELIIDDVTGFIRDYQFSRRYMLGSFNISVRKATPAERLEPFERYRRSAIRWLSRKKPFLERCYLERESMDFDDRLLTMKVKKTLYLDGVWQSEKYFKDVEDVIRKDLRITHPINEQNQSIAREIHNSQAVAIHMRWFDISNKTTMRNASEDYYQQAITLLNNKIESPRYFLFSDAPESVRAKLTSLGSRVTLVSRDRDGDENAYADLWLMTQCQHFIIANSTFGWWGAWLGGGAKKVVICPGDRKYGIGSWGFNGLIPEEWIKVSSRL